MATEIIMAITIKIGIYPKHLKILIQFISWFD